MSFYSCIHVRTESFSFRSLRSSISWPIQLNSIFKNHTPFYIFPYGSPVQEGLEFGPLDFQMHSHNQDVCPGYPERRDPFAGSRLPGTVIDILATLCHSTPWPFQELRTKRDDADRQLSRVRPPRSRTVWCHSSPAAGTAPWYCARVMFSCTLMYIVHDIFIVWWNILPIYYIVYIWYYVRLYFLRSREGTTVIINQRNVLWYMISHCHFMQASRHALLPLWAASKIATTSGRIYPYI